MSKDRVNQIVERNGLLGVIDNNKTLAISGYDKETLEAVDKYCNALLAINPTYEQWKAKQK